MIAGSNVRSSTKMCICAGTHRDLSMIPTAKDIYALIAACLCLSPVCIHAGSHNNHTFVLSSVAQKLDACSTELLQSVQCGIQKICGSRVAAAAATPAAAAATPAAAAA